MMTTVVGAESGQVLSPEARIDGKSQAEWSRLWWQWAASFQYDESPVADQTGQNCQLKQNGRVFFWQELTVRIERFASAAYHAASTYFFP